MLIASTGRIDSEAFTPLMIKGILNLMAVMMALCVTRSIVQLCAYSRGFSEPMPLNAKIRKHIKPIVWPVLLAALLGACTPAYKCRDDAAGTTVSSTRPCVQDTKEGIVPAEKTDTQAAPQKEVPTARSVPRAKLSDPTLHTPLPVPDTSVPQRGVVDPKTGQYLPPARDGVINPRTGEFYHDTGPGYVNPRTGQIIPKR